MKDKNKEIIYLLKEHMRAVKTEQDTVAAILLQYGVEVEDITSLMCLLDTYLTHIEYYIKAIKEDK